MSPHRYFWHLRPLEKWRWAGLRIRLALYPDDPQLVDEYLGVGRWLHQHGGHAAWPVASEAARLLMATAADPALPMYWRSLCLDNVYRPLDQLAQLAGEDPQRLDLARLRYRLARLDVSPADGTA